MLTTCKHSLALIQREEIASRGGQAQSAVVDVTCDEDMATALQVHLRKFKSLEIVCLNAGIMELGMFPMLYLHGVAD